MIEIRNLRKTYITGNKELHALDGIDLRIEEKTFTSIVGRSGSGKSTLLHLMGLLDSPTSGEILIGGRDINKFRGKEQAI
jgi:putative ABC transport system ATP-binding protein